MYMLKCPCGLVYVGQTMRNVKTRIKEHKGDRRNSKKGSQTDTTVARHFNEAKQPLATEMGGPRGSTTIKSRW
ncbi:hypothetical protein XELAEV_18018054mg [Xenopus laevis]|uniref:GIY-YIG domain-containing protein n=1 Tax=Xenopus laevis TaxID=8355 RepID=A0A974HTF0_XENLA|nr:hypothetical protein XELAEV_18018054mg [Xenopus laevis]